MWLYTTTARRTRCRCASSMCRPARTMIPSMTISTTGSALDATLCGSTAAGACQGSSLPTIFYASGRVETAGSDLPRHCRNVHAGLTGLLNRCGLEFVGPEPSQLSRRPVKTIGYLDHSHQPKASRTSRSRSSHSEKSYARNTLLTISRARWRFLAAYGPAGAAKAVILHVLLSQASDQPG